MAFALDQEALAVARSTDVAVRTELLSASLSRESNYGSASFQPVVMQKLRALQLLLMMILMLLLLLLLPLSLELIGSSAFTLLHYPLI